VLAAPGLVRADRPVPTHGVQSDDAPPAPNTSPAQGFQHFGEVEAGPGGELRVALRGQDGQELWSTTLPTVA
jgi:alkaline phosphatase D